MNQVFVLFLWIAVPALLAWGGLSFFPRLSRGWRIAMAALVAGMLFSGLLMWLDAAEGFCCREYPATVWTELWLYIPVGLLFSVAASLVLFVADAIKMRWRR